MFRKLVFFFQDLLPAYRVWKKGPPGVDPPPQRKLDAVCDCTHCGVVLIRETGAERPYGLWFCSSKCTLAWREFALSGAAGRNFQEMAAVLWRPDSVYGDSKFPPLYHPVPPPVYIPPPPPIPLWRNFAWAAEVWRKHLRP